MPSDDDKPHRPPKYVEGHYKPCFGDPEADYVILVHAWYPQMGDLKLATTDVDGDAAGVARVDGEPVYEGGYTVGAHVYGDEISFTKYGELMGVTEPKVRGLVGGE